ncbi:metallophosphoesterase [Aurantivibrio plasticivorans]
MYYAIGDCHGHIQPLRALVEAIPLEASDNLVLLGDYIDHGPASRDVLDYLIRLRRQPNVHCLIGNHELMMLGAAEDPDIEREWRRQGGEQTLSSLGVSTARAIPSRYLTFLRECLPLLSTRYALFVHAGVNHHKPLDRQTEEELYWQHRQSPYRLADGRRIVSAHTPRSQPLITDHFVGLDTGMGQGGPLTCIALETNSYRQADAKGGLTPWLPVAAVA